MYHAILFDLDGTLLDTVPDFTLILNRMLVRQGRAPVNVDEVRGFVSYGAMAVVRQGFGLDENAPTLPQLLEEFLALYTEQIPQTVATLFTDIDLVLTQLQDQNKPWGIMTNKARRFSEALLTRFDAFARCATLVCPDDVGQGKPDPAGLLLACQQMQLPPEDVLYVGDHPRDIDAAVRAGMPSLVAGWGYLPESPPIDSWGANCVAHTPRDLLHALLQTEAQ